MKKISTLTLTILALVFLTQCSPTLIKSFAFAERQPEVDAPTSKQIEKGHPGHTGHITIGQTGMHTYRASQFVVEIKSTTNAALVEQVFAEDINKDGVLDSIWLNYYGSWRFASSLGPEYRLIGNTASQKLLKDYLNLANDIRRNIQAQEERERARRAREESQRLEADGLKWRDLHGSNSNDAQRWNKAYVPDQSQTGHFYPN